MAVGADAGGGGGGGGAAATASAAGEGAALAATAEETKVKKVNVVWVSLFTKYMFCLNLFSVLSYFNIF